MNIRTLKIAGYIIFASSAIASGWGFYSNYTAFMSENDGSETLDSRLSQYSGAKTEPKSGYSMMMVYFGGFLASMVIFGMLTAHDVTTFLGSQASKLYYSDGVGEIPKGDYELAEEKWASGEHLEAIQMMRDYLEKHPREQHVAIRIAEIYENDLKNYLAAALEYEEILKHKLPAEQWGWTAIHLCNLYTSKLNRMNDAIDLLRRIDVEFGHTSAADKARKRLEMFESDGSLSMNDSSSTDSDKSFS
ncbi:MAG: hypothetical protein K9N48_07930 [Verrucomicrobia bacterium]|nr:hypothetical protein [Verrucomicrobiota bacterium]MCF7707414.1 hypothetical protein [Verrucomicrobiota bacterium]